VTGLAKTDLTAIIVTLEAEEESPNQDYGASNSTSHPQLSKRRYHGTIDELFRLNTSKGDKTPQGEREREKATSDHKLKHLYVGVCWCARIFDNHFSHPSSSRTSLPTHTFKRRMVQLLTRLVGGSNSCASSLS
jgi:hypothetical protein